MPWTGRLRVRCSANGCLFRQRQIYEKCSDFTAITITLITLISLSKTTNLYSDGTIKNIPHTYHHIHIITILLMVG